jgi:polysaccharide chain length determinant protein (PEP-CTERM system associated)
VGSAAKKVIVLPGKKYTPEDVLKILWHRKWLLIVPFVVATMCTYAVARRLPEVYRSETLIQVTPQRIPESYVRSTVTSRIEDRLGSIQQIITSRSRLERIIQDFNLYPEERKVMVMEDVVERMRSDITGPRIERGDAFRVGYTTGDPRLAQKVAEKLGSLFIDENLRDREALAEQTSQFLEGQLEEQRRRLLDHEKRLEEYRRAHSGELPSQLQANLQAMQSLQLQLQTLGEAMSRDRERRLLIERQLADIEANDLPASAPPPPAPATTEGQPAGSTSEQLDALIALRQTMLVRLKDTHPDVTAVSRRIRDLEAKLRAEVASKPAVGEPLPKPPSTAERLRENRMRDLRANLAAVDRELAANQTQEQQVRASIASYQAKVDAAPKRESELVELSRDYNTIQQIYTDLLSKREASKLSANVERQQIGEQFKILDAARVPERPFSPNRRKLLMMGATLGLGIGMVLLGLLEYRDSTFKTEDDVRFVLQMPVLAAVPMMASDRELKIRRRRKYLVALAAVVMVVSSAAAAVWKFYAL